MAHPSTAAAQQRIEQMLAGRLPPSIRDFEDFEHWLEQLRQLVFVSVTHLYHEVGDELDVERKRVRQEENSARKVWDLVPDEGVQLLKSTASIRSKIGRDLCDREDAGKPLPGELSLDAVEKLVLGLPDLGRFRIVADYSHDVLRALRVLVPKKREGLLGSYPRRGLRPGRAGRSVAHAEQGATRALGPGRGLADHGGMRCRSSPTRRPTAIPRSWTG